MLKNLRDFTTTYTNGEPNGSAVLHTDGTIVVRSDRGQTLIIKGLAEAVLEENAAYLEWREAQGGKVKRFKKKEAVVEALQLRWDTWTRMTGVFLADCPNAHGVYLDAGGNITEDTNGRLGLVIPTPSGPDIAAEDDWIIRNEKGEFYSCKPDVFAATYEQVIDDEDPNHTSE